MPFTAVALVTSLFPFSAVDACLYANSHIHSEEGDVDVGFRKEYICLLILSFCAEFQHIFGLTQAEYSERHAKACICAGQRA